MYDVAVVGAGPAGTSAAHVLGRARRSVLLLSGGETRNAPAQTVHGLISRDGTPPAELNATARKELAGYPSVEVRDATATAAAGSRGDFTLVTDDGAAARSRRIVLATGMRDVLPAIDGVAERWGRTVLHCPYCHGWEVRDQPLAVLAGTPADVFFAAALSRWSADVVLCTNGVGFSADQLAFLRPTGARCRDGTVVRIDGGADDVCVAFDAGPPERFRAAFLHAPMRQASRLAEAIGCGFLDDGTVEVDELGQTSVPGVVAVGDMARRRAAVPNMTYVATAMAQGVVAAVGLDQELFFSSLG